MIGKVPAAAAATSAGAEAGLGVRMASFLVSQTGARSLEPREGDDADAILSRAEAALRQGDVAGARALVAQLPEVAQTAMAGIGAATNAKMAEMLEAHEDQMVFARKVLEQKAKADERFMRRFAAIVEKHDKNLYGK